MRLSAARSTGLTMWWAKPCVAQSLHVLGAPVARDSDQRGALETGGPQRGGQRVPVHAGEPDVDEHQLRALPRAGCERARAVVGDRDLVTEEGEHVRERGGGVDVVVDDQDLQRSRGGRRGAGAARSRPAERACAAAVARARFHAGEAHDNLAAAARAVAEARGPTRRAA